MENLMIALQIMWKGMLGIFVACLIIMAAVWVIAKLTSGKQEEKKEQ